MYAYMSDVYLIPKTCTRTCSIFGNIHVRWSDPFLKIEWVGVRSGDSHPGPPVMRSHGRRCATRVCIEMGETLIGSVVTSSLLKLDVKF